jgi:dienelactone hydrolase
MFRPFAQFIDRLAIKNACGTVRSGFAMPGQGARARALLESRDFLSIPAALPNDFQFSPDETDFRFSSAVRTRFSENDMVQGRFFPCQENWRQKPLALLIHGWNGEEQYIKLFGFYGKKLNQAGLNAVAIELPFHHHRKPSDPASVQNFISDDLVLMLELTRQALTDISSTLAWFLGQGCPAAGLWGFSLGAWLAGLFVCSSQLATAAALTTPVPSLDEAISKLAFCAPIRSALQKDALDLAKLNLASHRPKISRENILIVAGKHDLFASKESIAGLEQAWNHPQKLEASHGHISILPAPRVIKKTAKWLAQKLPLIP